MSELNCIVFDHVNILSALHHSSTIRDCTVECVLTPENMILGVFYSGKQN